jgi:hypothetical protein
MPGSACVSASWRTCSGGAILMQSDLAREILCIFSTFTASSTATSTADATAKRNNVDEIEEARRDETTHDCRRFMSHTPQRSQPATRAPHYSQSE